MLGILRGRRLAIAALVFAACNGAPPPQQDTLPIHVAPPPNGEQLVVGPFDVPSGTEVQLCRTLKLSNTDPVAVNRLQVVLSQGSHHFIMFRSTKDFPDQVFPCWGTVNFDDWEFLIDVNKTGGNDWQLNDGQAFVMQPHQQIMIQAHFVNATTVKAPLGGAAIVNLYNIPPSQVAHELFGVFTVDTRIHIPPHSAYTTNRTCTFNQTVHIAAMTGHFHARGTDFAVNRANPEGQVFEQIYDNTNWDAPEFKVFDDPPLFNSDSEGVNFTCSYFNDTDNMIGWGGHADVQEHCNLFFQYYFHDTVAPNVRLGCEQGSGGW